MFRRLFGESKSKDLSRINPIDNQDRNAIRTINHLQQSEDMMNKKLEKFDQEISDIQTKARECLSKSIPDRQGALRLIKRRKQLEQQRDKLSMMKQNIELVNEQVQSSHFNRQITESLNIGNQHLKQAQKSMSTKKIEEIIDNITEQIDISNDINDLLATPISTNDLSTNDFDLEKELDYLNNEIIAENLTNINLPNAHSESIKISNKKDNVIQKQLEELQRLTTG